MNTEANLLPVVWPILLMFKLIFSLVSGTVSFSVIESFNAFYLFVFMKLIRHLIILLIKLIRFVLFPLPNFILSIFLNFLFFTQFNNREKCFFDRSSAYP